MMHIAAVSEIVNLLIPSLVTLHVRPLYNLSLSHRVLSIVLFCMPQASMKPRQMQDAKASCAA